MHIYTHTHTRTHKHSRAPPKEPQGIQTLRPQLLWPALQGYIPFFRSTDLPRAPGVAYGEELADASFKEGVEDDPPEEGSTDVLAKEELELEDKTLAPGLCGLKAE